MPAFDLPAPAETFGSNGFPPMTRHWAVRMISSADLPELDAHLPIGEDEDT